MQDHIDKTFWNYYETKQKHYFSANIPELNIVIKEVTKYFKKSKAKILDVGCGSGYLIKELFKKGYECYGMDYATKNINQLQKEFDKENLFIIVKEGNATNILFPSESFDCIIFSELLEHLSTDDYNLAMKEAYRCLENKGILIITTPNSEDLSKGIIFCPYCHKTFHRVLHKQSFNKEKLKQILKSHNFNIKKIREIYEVSQKFPKILIRIYILIKKIFKVDAQTLLVIAEKS